MLDETCSLWQSHAQPLRSTGAANIDHAIPRIAATALTSEQFFQQHQKPGSPVIISGLLDEGTTWNLEFLCDRLGDLTFPVRYYGQQRYQQDKRQWQSSGSGVEVHSLSFSQYAAMLRNGEARAQDAYLARCSLRNAPLENLSELWQAEQHLGLKMPATDLNLWVGAGGHTSCLHYDPMDGTLMQLYGEKRILLFPPSQTYRLYPIPVLKQLRHGLKLRSVYSQVYPDRPDFEAFPLFREALAVMQVGVLQAGDILYLPAGWWHEVTSLGEGVVCSVNRFWHVLPLIRALSSWNKWRAHLASLLATPHVMLSFLAAFSTRDWQEELRKLEQRL